MDYIPKEKKIEQIRKYLLKAKFVTIATSPFFIDQNKAIKTIKTIFDF